MDMAVNKQRRFIFLQQGSEAFEPPVRQRVKIVGMPCRSVRHQCRIRRGATGTAAAAGSGAASASPYTYILLFFCT